MSPAVIELQNCGSRKRAACLEHLYFGDHHEFSKDKDQSGWVEGRLAREFALKSMDNVRHGKEATLYGE